MTDRELLVQTMAQLDNMLSAIVAQIGPVQRPPVEQVPQTPPPQTMPLSPGGPTSMGGIPVGTGLPLTPTTGGGSTPNNGSGRFFEVHGDILNGGFLRFGFAGPSDAPFPYSFSVLPQDTRRWNIVGDGGFAQGNVTVSLDGGPDMNVGEAGGVNIGPGAHSLVIRCVDNADTRANGVITTAISLSRVA